MDRRSFIKATSLLPFAAGATVAPPFDVRGRHRARDLGVRIGRLATGPLNAITDVAGVEVGQVTLVEGNGPLRVGSGPVRTGITTIWPRRDIGDRFLCCGSHAPNGNGEVTGLLETGSLGVITTPLCTTNTSSVGMVYDAVQSLATPDDLPAGVPVVGETWDAWLNDIEGRHVRRQHVLRALEEARGGPVAEGNVGGGTGMICYGFKGGIGTSSRTARIGNDKWTVGALVQANHGSRERVRFTVDNVPVGEALAGYESELEGAAPFNSIIMVLATDAPLLSYQLNRLARRAVHGLARTGSLSANSSGDFAIAFSTANPVPREQFWRGAARTLAYLDQSDIEPMFEAAAEAVEEAILNALFMADDMQGRDGNLVRALPLQRTLQLLHEHGRLNRDTGGTADVAL